MTIMEYYISANNEYVKGTLERKQKELTKEIKEACALAFTKGNISGYEINIYIFRGTFSGDIKEMKDYSTIYEVEHMDAFPYFFLSNNLDEIVAQYDKNIAKVKEFISKIKKLK